MAQYWINSLITDTMLRILSLTVLALFFILAGINHFINPITYLNMMPPYLPFPEVLNLISGAAEIVGGIGVLIRPLRRAAGWGLITLLVAIFPANLQMALHGLQGVNIASWILWLRLPFQFVLIAWVYWTCVSVHLQSPDSGLSA